MGRILPLITEHFDRFSRAEFELYGGSSTNTSMEEGLSGGGNTGDGNGGNQKSSTTTTTTSSKSGGTRRRLTPLTESPELSLFLSQKYASLIPSKKLHEAINTTSPNSKPQEEFFLKNLLDRILPFVMEKNEISSKVVGILIREVVGGNVLVGVVEGVCDEDFWNRFIDEKAGAAIRDQKMVTQFREALDAQNVSSLPHPPSTSTSTSTSTSKPPTTTKLNPSSSNLSSSSSPRKRTEEISIKTTLKQFENFYKTISKIENLLEIRRLKSDLNISIRKQRSNLLLLQNQGQNQGKEKNDKDKDDEILVDGEKVGDLINYIERLEIALKKADKRIEELGGSSNLNDTNVGVEITSRNNLISDSTSTGKLSPSSNSNTSSTTIPTSTTEISLRQILLSPSSLSYFMEFQDRRNKSLLRVQFWLLVEGLKDPLVIEDSNDPSDLSANQVLGGLVVPSEEVIRTTKEDLQMIWETYFSKSNLLNSNPKCLEIIKSFLNPNNTNHLITSIEIRKVKQTIFLIQNEVLKKMEEEDFPIFKKSDLFFKALINISTDNINIAPLPPPPPPPPLSISNTSIDPLASSIPINQPRILKTTSPSPLSLPAPTPTIATSIFQRSTSPPPQQSPMISRPTSPHNHSYSISLSTPNILVPPQISFQAATSTSTNITSSINSTIDNNRPNIRRTQSDDRKKGVLSRKSSLDPLTSVGIGTGMTKRKVSPLSDSLEFLMSSSGMENEDGSGSRSPLFIEEEGEGRNFRSGISTPYRINSAGMDQGEQEDDDDDDYVQIQTIEAIQEALNDILAMDARSTAARLPTSTTSTYNSTTLRDQNNNSTNNGGSLSSSQELLGPTTTGSISASMSRQVSNEVDGGKKKLTSGSNDNLSTRKISTTIPTFIKTNSTTTNSTNSKKDKRVFDDFEEDYLSDDSIYQEDSRKESFREGQGQEEKNEESFDPKDIRLAAPGDLQLPLVEIKRINILIEKLKSQEIVVGQLIRKAELTGITKELKILLKSRESLRRELRGLEFQKRQFEVQESENQLEPGRTTVTISGTTIGQSNNQSFQLYLVEVHQLASNGTFGSGWIVTRRYSEFLNLFNSLKENFGNQVKILDLPSKRLVNSYNETFVEQRRIGLEKFLQRLVKISVICQSNELRSFLSQQNISLPNLESLETNTKKNSIQLFPGQGLVKSFYRSVTSGIDDMFTNSGPSSMMDTIIQRLLSQQAELTNGGILTEGGGVQEEDLVGSSTPLLNNKKVTVPLVPGGGVGGEEGLSYFTAPICDFFVTLFELKEKNNWLRRQAILIILQQVLGGTIERKFRDAVKLSLGADQLITYIDILKNSMFPNGELKPKEPPCTAEERLQTRDSANRKLSALMPDVAANLIGRSNARMGARRLFAVLQNSRLNKHLLYCIIDEVIAVLFPELDHLNRT